MQTKLNWGPVFNSPTFVFCLCQLLPSFVYRLLLTFQGVRELNNLLRHRIGTQCAIYCCCLFFFTFRFLCQISRELVSVLTELKWRSLMESATILAIRLFIGNFMPSIHFCENHIMLPSIHLELLNSSSQYISEHTIETLLSLKKKICRHFCNFMVSVCGRAASMWIFWPSMALQPAAAVSGGKQQQITAITVRFNSRLYCMQVYRWNCTCLFVCGSDNFWVLTGNTQSTLSEHTFMPFTAEERGRCNAPLSSGVYMLPW